MERYFVIYKPAGMLSQFVSPYAHSLLGALDFDFPEGTSAVGRLDVASEGLLLLTTDKTLAKRLLPPERGHARTYLVLVDREVDEGVLQRLREGLTIQVSRKGNYLTQPCQVKRVCRPNWLTPTANTLHETLPHSWLEFELTEGKNRQIRKMCAAVRHKCRRLVRTGIESLGLNGLQPGEVREVERRELYVQLGLDPDAPYFSGR